jgi:DNA primase
LIQDYILNTFEKNGIKYTLWKNQTEAKFCCINPDHQDKNASCSINLETGVFGCFGCRMSGNVEKFIKILTGKDVKITEIISEEELLKFNLGKVYQKSVEVLTQYHQDKEFEDLLQIECQYFVSCLQHQKAYEYLKKRKFTDSTIKKFNLKFAIKGQYENRIIIPMFLKTKFIGFNARLITVDKQNSNELRYRFFVNKLHFPKYVYNFENITKNIPYCILAEGQFDTMYLDQCGFKNVISCMSTGINEYQLGSIMQFKRIIFCFDNDENKSGIKAVQKNAKHILKVNPDKEIFYVDLPLKKDPNECSLEELKNSFNKLKKIKLKGDTNELGILDEIAR